jgi:hypothetical protein
MNCFSEFAHYNWFICSVCVCGGVEPERRRKDGLMFLSWSKGVFKSGMWYLWKAAKLSQLCFLNLKSAAMQSQNTPSQCFHHWTCRRVANFWCCTEFLSARRNNSCISQCSMQWISYHQLEPSMLMVIWKAIMITDEQFTVNEKAITCKPEPPHSLTAMILPMAEVEPILPGCERGNRSWEINFFDFRLHGKYLR